MITLKKDGTTRKLPGPFDRYTTLAEILDDDDYARLSGGGWYAFGKYAGHSLGLTDRVLHNEEITLKMVVPMENTMRYYHLPKSVARRTGFAPGAIVNARPARYAPVGKHRNGWCSLYFAEEYVGTFHVGRGWKLAKRPVRVPTPPARQPA